jgi:hypothetical protein
LALVAIVVAALVAYYIVIIALAVASDDLPHYSVSIDSIAALTP